jgi:hypothetical protein
MSSYSGKYGHSMASSYDDNGQTRQYSSSLEYALSRSSSWLGYLIHVSAKFPLGIILIDANRDRQSYGRYLCEIKTLQNLTFLPFEGSISQHPQFFL